MRDSTEEHVELRELELVVVPVGIWHRFQDSLQLKVLTITPPSTEHRLDEIGNILGMCSADFMAEGRESDEDRPVTKE